MRQLLILPLFFLPVLAKAQVNLVRNGSFEQYSSCPNGIDQIKKAIFWQTTDSLPFTSSCSPEYCNTCANAVTSGVSVPSNGIYYHYPRSGNGMVQANMYFDSSYFGETAQRNYTQGHLYGSLIAGKNYCITFYVTLAQASAYANNHIGAYLDNGKIDSAKNATICGLPQVTIYPQAVTTTIINDTLNWVKIQGSFIADGSEKIITLGNFFDAAHTDTTQLHYPISSGEFSYYLIDDVSVIESSSVADAGPDAVTGVGVMHHIGTYEEGMPCTWYAYGDTTPIGYGGGINVTPVATGTYKYVIKLDLCGNITYDTMTLTVWPAGLNYPYPQVDKLRMYPNPASNLLTVENANNCEIAIFDVVGKHFLHAGIASDKEVIDISALPIGIYMVQLIDYETKEKVVRQVLKE